MAVGKKIEAELVTSILTVCDCSQGTATSAESMYIVRCLYIVQCTKGSRTMGQAHYFRRTSSSLSSAFMPLHFCTQNSQTCNRENCIDTHSCKTNGAWVMSRLFISVFQIPAGHLNSLCSH